MSGPLVLNPVGVVVDPGIFRPGRSLGTGPEATCKRSAETRPRRLMGSLHIV